MTNEHLTDEQMFDVVVELENRLDNCDTHADYVIFAAIVLQIQTAFDNLKAARGEIARLTGENALLRGPKKTNRERVEADFDRVRGKVQRMQDNTLRDVD